MRVNYTFDELEAGPQLLNAARERALKEYRRSDDVSERHVRQWFEIQAGTSIRVHRDWTAEASGPVVFSNPFLTRRIPNCIPPIRFTSIDGPVTISCPTEFAALPANFAGKVFLRLVGDNKDVYNVQTWLLETQAQLMRATIANEYDVGAAAKPGKKNSPPRC